MMVANMIVVIALGLVAAVTILQADSVTAFDSRHSTGNRRLDAKRPDVHEHHVVHHHTVGGRLSMTKPAKRDLGGFRRFSEKDYDSSDDCDYGDGDGCDDSDCDYGRPYGYYGYSYDGSYGGGYGGGYDWFPPPFPYSVLENVSSPAEASFISMDLTTGSTASSPAGASASITTKALEAAAKSGVSKKSAKSTTGDK